MSDLEMQECNSLSNVDDDGNNDPNFVFKEINDVKKFLTSKQTFDELIMPYDAALDIIGIIRSSHEPIERVIGATGQKKLVINVKLEIGDGFIIPFAIWDDEVKIWQRLLQVNNVILIDSPFAREVQQSSFSNQKNFTLTCRSNTVIHVLGKQLKEEVVNKASEKLAKEMAETSIDNVDIKEYVEGGKLLKFKGVMKNSLRWKNKNLGIVSGLLTDLKYRIGLTLYNCTDISIVEEGDEVIIICQIKIENNILHFEGKCQDLAVIEKKKIKTTELSGMSLKPKIFELNYSEGKSKKLKLE